jgi:DNA repair protein RadC
MNKELSYKYKMGGFSLLSDVELLKMMTHSDNPSIINGNFRELSRMSVKELQNGGLTQREAEVIASAFEAARRKQRLDALSQENEIIIHNSSDIYQIMLPNFVDKNHEEFHALYLNRKNKLIGQELISVGGVSGTVTDVRIVFKKAIAILASGIIVAHNHPSGNINPSESDKRITQKIKESGALLDIQLLDHLIIGDSTYYSFADNGNL